MWWRVGGLYEHVPFISRFAKRRGTCMFHAGLGQNCDYRDMVGAVDEVNHWGSDMAPGRRRK